MNTPIVDFVKKYANSGVSRLHMPGHKGRKMLGAEALDITEIDGADLLYGGNGIIFESQKNASRLFGTSATFFSAEGSTLCIKAMLATAVSGVENPRVLAARNVHKAFVYAAALLNIDVSWIAASSGSICESEITPELLENALKSAPKPSAVYVTSPDYLGNILDISALSLVCKRYGVPLLVDNAHGSYLHFLNTPAHPIDLGAAMCTDSAHKTLPVLTGGAYLHIGRDYPEAALIAAKKMSIFASTSPSYLILQSLDLCNKYLADGFKGELAKTIKQVEKLKELFIEKGFILKGTEPLKITVNTCSGGYNGEDFAALLRAEKIEPEFCDDANVVLMVSTKNTRRDFARIIKFIKKIPILTPINTSSKPLPLPERVMDIRSAVFSQSERVEIGGSIGKICAAPTVSCPPAIPIVVSGERISEQAVEIMQKYNIENIDIIKDA